MNQSKQELKQMLFDFSSRRCHFLMSMSDFDLIYHVLNNNEQKNTLRFYFPYNRPSFDFVLSVLFPQ